LRIPGLLDIPTRRSQVSVRRQGISPGGTLQMAAYTRSRGAAIEIRGTSWNWYSRGEFVEARAGRFDRVSPVGR
jgi:hypothetical protein